MVRKNLSQKKSKLANPMSRFSSNFQYILFDINEFNPPVLKLDFYLENG